MATTHTTALPDPEVAPIVTDATVDSSSSSSVILGIPIADVKADGLVKMSSTARGHESITEKVTAAPTTIRAMRRKVRCLIILVTSLGGQIGAPAPMPSTQLLIPTENKKQIWKVQFS